MQISLSRFTLMRNIREVQPVFPLLSIHNHDSIVREQFAYCLLTVHTDVYCLLLCMYILRAVVYIYCMLSVYIHICSINQNLKLKESISIFIPQLMGRYYNYCTFTAIYYSIIVDYKYKLMSYFFSSVAVEFPVAVGLDFFDSGRDISCGVPRTFV